MPLKDGKMPTDSLVDVSPASKTDREALVGLRNYDLKHVIRLFKK
jgi:hypothetical protein